MNDLSAFPLALNEIMLECAFLCAYTRVYYASYLVYLGLND